MKLNVAIPGLLIALLAGFSGTNQNTTVSLTMGILTANAASRTSNPARSQTPRKPKYSPKSLGLSEAKFKEISQLEGLPYTMKNPYGKVDISKKFRIALPTYIPDGFRAKLEVSKGENPRYSILYKNQNNQCFSFKGFIPKGSPYSHPVVLETFDVSSIGLGQTLVNYVKYDRSSDKKLMKTSFRINGQSYEFESSEESCTLISKREATKVIKSIDYLL
ncbi:MAG: DUF4367 domain-containing protein [Microcoleus sp. PH2017_40_RAT_O_B]|uniref:DUF4367 domain-containing protein n=1 Tax=unclassified Microcoleus TaxID=2642155 RepID=UPI001D3F78FF|nr:MULTISPECIES: DUF4367 domain-containing protein [unclassified Microcoleus]MCC3573339.1 DUF4367 domain-containing protein [Microcoleus sp. PH2017_34_RAT_O_A]MCC3610727.1 DUF4367 domain-containing protein [Microcoleus sp. PH2017_40_RAT_O_B]